MIRACSMLFIFLTLLQISELHNCNSFENVLVEVVEENEISSNETINGCLERKRLHDKTIIRAYIRNQVIPQLGNDSVRHLVKLKEITFRGCTLEILEPHAFRNLPRLERFSITYCNLKEIPKDVFNAIPSIENIDLQHNQIDFIESQAFANLSSLTEVYLRNNTLDYWNREWFVDSANLQVVNFRLNKLRMIPRKAFAALPKLKTIYFGWNEISTIQPDAFYGLEFLRLLELQNNRLKTINENVFPKGFNIETVMINANHLNYLPKKLLDKISVRYIILEYNPWNCVCLDKINSWVTNKNFTQLKKTTKCESDYAPVCAYPNTSQRVCSENVDEELTERYLGVLRGLTVQLAEGCARLD